jgi:hypothetical protein
MSAEQQHQAWETAVQEAIRSLRFGSVVVTVHEGKVTQIEKREKIRPDEAGSTRGHKHETTTLTLNGRPE